MITQLLTRRVASDTEVIRFGQAACFVAAGLIPLLAFHKFAELGLSEAQLLVGVIATIPMALFYTALGVLLESKTKAA
jgi:hypothetical protein